MATDEDTPMKDPSSDSGSDNDSDNDGSDSGDVAPKVEWLATTRAKRSTAGNRLKAMLANEEPAAEDDDLELLFAEDGDDEGFEDAEANDSDVHMDSSSDDEDQDEGAEEDAGEKELQRQAKQKRLAQRKRGANAAIPAKFRKKVRIENPPTASQSPAPQQAAPAPRPKKKSERASWLPTAAEMPTRASERQTTRLSKEQLHAQMIEREVKRKKLVEAMERKAKKAEALKKPPMTQEERLAEAARVEKRNSKSLNRWEEAEKQREEERLRKIAALQNRKLDGPVVTFWSGIQELDSEQMKHIGKMVSIEEKVPRKKRQSLAAPVTDSQPVPPVDATNTSILPGTYTAPSTPMQGPAGSSNIATFQTPSTLQPHPSNPLQQPQPATPAFEAPRTASMPLVQPSPTLQAPSHQQGSLNMQPLNNPFSSPSTVSPSQSSLQAPPRPMAPPPIPPPPDMRSGGSGFLAPPTMMGFGAPPELSQMPVLGVAAPNTQSSGFATPSTNRIGPHGPSPLSMPQPPAINHPPAMQVGTPMKEKPLINRPLQIPQASTLLQPFTPNKMLPGTPDTPLDSPALSQQAGKVTKSCIILSNFDETAIKDRQVQTQILFGRKMNKLAKPAPQPLCVITNHPAKYRDPKTGLPYHNIYAYKMIQRLHRGDYKWSRLLGAWVGSGTFAARGVPERFLNPAWKKPEEEKATQPTLAVDEKGMAPAVGEGSGGGEDAVSVPDVKPGTLPAGAVA